MTHICPFCRHEVRDGEPCPGCKASVLASDWPKNVVTPAGRIRSPEDGRYRFPDDAPPVSGRLDKPYRQALPTPQIGDRISVGGSHQHIAIADVASPLAEFYRHLIPGGDEWWVVRCSAAAKVLLNGKQEIDNCRLEEGDIVTVAGVPILYTGTSLIAGGSEQLEILFETGDLTVVKNGKTILNKINFEIRSGEFIGILGPSGCGKSSLIQQLVGLGRATSGSILINGEPYAQKADTMQLLTAYMPQAVALHNDLSLEEELKCFSLLHDTSMQDAEAKLSLLGLRQQTAKRIGDLSGGQQRRVGIALELLRKPQLLVLDEPTAGLDPASETQVMKYLRRLADQGKSILCATHIMENLDKFDKILVLSQGFGVFFGTPEELLAHFRIAHPVELYTLLGGGSREQQCELAQSLAQKFRQDRAKASPERPEPPPLPHTDRGASPGKRKKQYRGYLLRQALEFFSFRHAAHPVKEFFTSACFIQLLLQPILIAAALKFACAHLFYNSNSSNMFDLCFFSCLAVFWLGLNNAIRELVRERIPWRCLERLEKVSLFGYIGAKLSWTALLAFIQTLLFYVVLYVIRPVSLATNDGKGVVNCDIILFLVLYAVCLSGAWLGVAFSAIFTKENAAVAMLPNILVPVLFFSGTIVGDIKNNDGLHNRTAACIEKWMPCHAPAKYLERRITENITKKKTSHKSDDCHPVGVGGIMVLFLLLAILIQNRREKNWEGR